MPKLSKLNKSKIDVLSRTTIEMDGTTQPQRATIRRKSHTEHFNLLRKELIGKSELCYEMICTIVFLRREVECKYHAKRFHLLLKHGIDRLCAELDSRWLVSISDTLADYGKSPLDRLAGISISMWVNTIKMAESERYFMADPSLDVKEIEDYSKSKDLTELWDGMTLMKIMRADMPRILLNRARTNLTPSPIALKIFDTLLERVKSEPNLMTRLAALYPDFWEEPSA